MGEYTTEAFGDYILGTNHMIGPGGKGSNQAVAIAKAGGNVNFISKIGNDQYGKMAKKNVLRIWS